MAFGIGRSLSAPLLVLNFFLYLISACLAGWALNRNLDATTGLGEGPVGLASVFAGTNHVRVWRGDSLSAAAAVSLMAWLLTLLAMGVACKEIHTGGMNRQRRLKTLEAFIIILAFCELLYLLSLQAGFFGGSDEGYNHNRTAAKSSATTYGTPAANAV